MEAYKNYLVNETTKNGMTEYWTIAVFHTYKQAVDFVKAYNPRPEVESIEVLATDEDPDTYTHCDRVYSINLRITPEERKLRELAKRCFDLVAPWDREDGTEESTAELIKNDPQAVIEFLLDQIDGFNA